MLERGRYSRALTMAVTAQQVAAKHETAMMRSVMAPSM
jgi:hypothetical protein